MRQHWALQVLLLLLLVWGALRVLQNVAGNTVVIIIVVLAAVTAVTIWMLHYERPRLARVYRQRGCREFIDLVCRVTKTQPPVETERQADESKPPAFEDLLVARDEAGFAEMARKLKAVIKGHGPAVTEIVDRLQGSVLLRLRSTGPVASPLFVLLFAGGEGIGKRYLGTKFGNLLYKKPAVLALDLRSVSPDNAVAALFGSENHEGTLVSTIKRQPYHMIILEHLEAAPPKVQERLQRLFQTGSCMDPKSGTRVSFEHCVFLLTTTACVAPLLAAREKLSGNRAWNQRAHEILAAEAHLDQALLETIDHVHVLENLSGVTKAEILCLMIDKACRKHRVNLEWIDPELLAEEVDALPDHLGLSTAKARVDRLLRDPLVRAARSGSQSLSLRKNQITMVSAPEDVWQ